MKTKPRCEGCSWKDSCPDCSNITVTLSSMRCFHLLFLLAGGKAGFPNLFGTVYFCLYKLHLHYPDQWVGVSKRYLNNSGLNWYSFLSLETVEHKRCTKTCTNMDSSGTEQQLFQLFASPLENLVNKNSCLHWNCLATQIVVSIQDLFLYW